MVGLWQFTPNPKNKGVVNKFTIRIVNGKIKGGLNSIRPQLEKVVDDAIRKHADEFIPDQEQAAQLGVGNFAGGFDLERLNTAWAHLLLNGPNDENKVSFLSITTRPGVKANIARIKFRIFEEGFKLLPISNLEIESVELPIIPWMRWFLEGALISGFRFTDKAPVPATSRTGAGIMIRGGLWTFPPQGLGLFKKVIDTVDKDLHTKMLALLKPAVKRANVGRQ